MPIALSSPPIARRSRNRRQHRPPSQAPARPSGIEQVHFTMGGHDEASRVVGVERSGIQGLEYEYAVPSERAAEDSLRVSLNPGTSLGAP